MGGATCCSMARRTHWLEFWRSCRPGPYSLATGQAKPPAPPLNSNQGGAGGFACRAARKPIFLYRGELSAQGVAGFLRPFLEHGRQVLPRPSVRRVVEQIARLAWVRLQVVELILA